MFQSMSSFPDPHASLLTLCRTNVAATATTGEVNLEESWNCSDDDDDDDVERLVIDVDASVYEPHTDRPSHLQEILQTGIYTGNSGETREKFEPSSEKYIKKRSATLSAEEIHKALTSRADEYMRNNFMQYRAGNTVSFKSKEEIPVKKRKTSRQNVGKQSERGEFQVKKKKPSSQKLDDSKSEYEAFQIKIKKYADQKVQNFKIEPGNFGIKTWTTSSQNDENFKSEPKEFQQSASGTSNQNVHNSWSELGESVTWKTLGLKAENFKSEPREFQLRASKTLSQNIHNFKSECGETVTLKSSSHKVENFKSERREFQASALKSSCQNEHNFESVGEKCETSPSEKVEIIASDGKLSCSLCDRTYTLRGFLTRHMDAHAAQFRCDVCNRSFLKLTSLELHRKIHTDEKPFGCDLCERKFKYKNNLAAHKRAHEGYRPFPCPICGKLFTRSFSVRVHMRIHTGDKPFKCSICLCKFSCYQYLKTHRLTRHNGMDVSLEMYKGVVEKELKKNKMVQTDE